MEEIWVAWLVGLTFSLFIGFFALMYLLSIRLRRVKKEVWKEKIYACGEDIRPEKLNVPSRSFYSVLLSTFRLNWFKKIHTGEMTTYLLWIFSGLVVLLIILLFFW
jgi:hypothetical protein